MYLEGYKKLASAILNQAIGDYKDYTKSLKDLRKKRKSIVHELVTCSDKNFDNIFMKLIKLENNITKLVKERKDIIKFLRSEWGMTLSGQNNESLINKLKGIK